jgi:4-hydroxy-4-methyl-2-oxoglutarate aldolase
MPYVAMCNASASFAILLFARGHFIVMGKDRVQVDGITVPVSIAGIQVRSGDLVVPDDTGVVMIPWENAEEGLAAAIEISATEESIEQAIRRGDKLSDARKKYGYHKLSSE